MTTIYRWYIILYHIPRERRWLNLIVSFDFTPSNPFFLNHVVSRIHCTTRHFFLEMVRISKPSYYYYLIQNAYTKKSSKIFIKPFIKFVSRHHKILKRSLNIDCHWFWIWSAFFNALSLWIHLIDPSSYWCDPFPFYKKIWYDIFLVLLI